MKGKQGVIERDGIKTVEREMAVHWEVGDNSLPLI